MRAVTSDHGLRQQQLLNLAHDCLSAVLQFDYLSNGAGHRYSTVPDRGRIRPLQLRAGKTGGASSHPQAAEDRAGGAAGARIPDIVRQYLSEVGTRRRLSSSAEYRLARAACDGDPSARRQLIEHQLGLVVMIARPYRNRGLPLLDLIEEGNIGLMLAIDKFDPERGYRFSTYAKWWIRQSIELALMTQPRVVHVPVHVMRALKRRSKAGSGSAVVSDASRLLLYDASDQAETAQLNPDGELQPFIDSLAAAEHEQPDLRLHLRDQRERVQAALGMLNGKEKLVIELRFGLAGGAARTLESIAAQLGLSSERVRQIQSEALAKLRMLLASRRGFGRLDLL